VKDIICITDEKAWKYGFIAAIKGVLRDDEANIEHLNPRAEGISMLASTIADIIVISATIPKKDMAGIFQVIAKNDNSKSNIFLVSEDFDSFSEVLKVGSFPHIHPLSAPVIFDELAKQLPKIVMRQVKHNCNHGVYCLDLYRINTEEVISSIKKPKAKNPSFNTSLSLIDF
jgi:hypothetical protein